MLKRTMDAAVLNTAANDPRVRPFGGGEGTIDLSAAIGNPENYAFVNEFGGFLVVKLERGLYEVHSMMLPEGRGPETIQDVRSTIRFMFAATDCMEIVTKVPQGNAAALGMCRATGFSKSFERTNAWHETNGDRVNLGYYTLSFSAWRARDTVIVERGVWFHTELERVTAILEKPIPAHADDTAHFRAVGACVVMFEAGNPVKAVALYNRWALMTGYTPIKLISVNPVVIDTDGVVIAIQNSNMEVLRCPSQQ